MDIEYAKRLVAEHACRLLIEEYNDSRIVGLGTGSTVKYFIDACLSKDFFSNKKIVVSSYDTLLYVKKYKNIHVIDPMGVDYIDVYIDGADEVSSLLDLVKGRGAAHLREKMLALRAGTRIYIVDYTKYTGKPYLYKKPIPVEIVPNALPYVLHKLELDGLFRPVIRMGKNKDGPIVTDNGLFVLDLYPLKEITNPGKVDKELRLIHGVVETGIFPHEELVDIVMIGYSDHVDIKRVA